MKNNFVFKCVRILKTSSSADEEVFEMRTHLNTELFFIASFFFIYHTDVFRVDWYFP